MLIKARQGFGNMERWVDYITTTTATPYLWTGGTHYGDWLGLDAPSGSYRGSGREDFIATAYYAYSTELLIKAGKVFGRNMSEYETLHDNIVRTFRQAFPVYKTQTEHVLAAHFHLAANCRKTADALAGMVRADGCCIRTGFVGTSYIRHVLSGYGYGE